MNPRIGYIYFLTALMAGLLYILVLHPVTLSQDAREILALVLGALSSTLAHVVQSDFRVQNPTQGQIGPKAAL